MSISQCGDRDDRIEDKETCYISRDWEQAFDKGNITLQENHPDSEQEEDASTRRDGRDHSKHDTWWGTTFSL